MQPHEVFGACSFACFVGLVMGLRVGRWWYRLDRVEREARRSRFVEVAELLLRLDDYAEHEPACERSRREPGEMAGCSCGLDKLRDQF